MVATHIDRKHIHNHIVLNSVHQETGKKWQFSKAQLYDLREQSDSLCRQYGLSVIDNGKGWRSYGEYTGQSWKRQLAQDIAKSLARSMNREDFLHYLHQSGISADFGATNILFTLPDGKKCSSVSLKSYGDFSKGNIERHLQYNHSAVRAGLGNHTVLVQAFEEIAALFPDRNSTDMQVDYFNGRMPRLEGQALIEWILMYKVSSSVSYTSNPQPLEQRQRGLLETLDEPASSGIGQPGGSPHLVCPSPKEIPIR